MIKVIRFPHVPDIPVYSEVPCIIVAIGASSNYIQIQKYKLVLIKKKDEKFNN